jgi:peptidoglycan/xylan/chitin deacetylase (PgdA/CDA1 family)
LLNVNDLREQFRSSRRILEDILGERITAVALPHGAYNDAVIDVAIEEGYQKIYSLDPIVIGNDDRLSSPLIGRFSISPDDWIIEYYLTINGAYRWLAPWRTFLSKFKRWYQTI